MRVNAGVQSPCVSICRLDERKLCVGCWRTLEEIAGWSKMNDQQKQSVLNSCAQRQSAALTT
ncbi:MAG: DUF1289 domain-containing protein [Spongiibacteraceae bacterium]